MTAELDRSKGEWEEQTLSPFLERSGERKEEFQTHSHIPVERLYLPPEAGPDLIETI